MPNYFEIDWVVFGKRLLKFFILVSMAGKILHRTNIFEQLWKGTTQGSFLWSLLKFHQIFTFPLRVFKWTSSFEMWFIPSWTNRFKPHPHTRHLSGLTSSPSNNAACLLTFVGRWTRIAMTLSEETWRFGCSKPYVMSDLIQNIWKPAKKGEKWKLILDW